MNEPLAPPLINAASLETKCPRCQGARLIHDPDLNAETPCSACRGLGSVPTEMGRTLIHFLERHMPGVVA